jgi:hypothetical protein
MVTNKGLERYIVISDLPGQEVLEGEREGGV